MTTKILGNAEGITPEQAERFAVFIKSTCIWLDDFIREIAEDKDNISSLEYANSLINVLVSIQTSMVACFIDNYRIDLREVEGFQSLIDLIAKKSIITFTEFNPYKKDSNNETAN
jgi:hypothetical protein